MHDDPPSSLTDDEFIVAFENCSLGSFRHRDHLRLAWLYLQQEPYESAVHHMENSIRRFAAHHGASQKYHHTLTLVWMRLVAAHTRQSWIRNFDEFLEANPDLLDKALPGRFYSPDRLNSEAARGSWVDADLRALP